MAGSTPLSTLTASLPSFPTSAEIAANLRQAVGGLNSLITNFNVGGLSQTYLEAIAIALGSDASTLPGSTVEGAYEILNAILRAAYIATAGGFYLDLKCADVGVYRKAATYATSTVLFVNSVAAPAGGATIPAGAVVSADSADPTQGPTMFLTLTPAPIGAGNTVSNAATVLAINAGSSGNCAANTITTIRSGGATAASCFNPARATGGADTEGDDAPNGGLRARGLAAIADASQCTLAAIADDARKYNGITSAVCVDLRAPDGTFVRGDVLVYCDDGTGDLASSANVNNAALVAFQADLDAGKWRAAGVSVFALGSVRFPVTASLAIDVGAAYLSLGHSASTVATAAQAAVYGMINAQPQGAPVTLAGIIDTAKAIPGVSNVLVASVSINGAAADLITLPQQVARCVNAPADVTVTVQGTTTYA